MVDENVPHNCVDEKLIKPLVEPTFIKPNFIRTKSSHSFNGTSLAISSNAPKDMTLEDLKNFQNSSKGIITQFRSIFKVLKTTIKNPSKENIRLLVFAGVFFILWFWTKYSPEGFNFMMPGGLKGVFAVLTGSFNNVPARVLHFSSLITLMTAFLPGIATSKQSFLGNIKSVLALMRTLLKDKKGTMFSVAIASFGFGLFLSNYLMRNNSSNKYMVCLTLGVTILLSTSGLFKSTFVKLSIGFFNDLSRIFRFETFLNKYKLALQIGVGSALVSSYLICLIRGAVYSSITDHLGYILGVIVFAFGFVKAVTSK
jgi:hypothetical protein